jgi:hypothetical protein
MGLELEATCVTGSKSACRTAVSALGIGPGRITGNPGTTPFNGHKRVCQELANRSDFHLGVLSLNFQLLRPLHEKAARTSYAPPLHSMP